MTIKHKSTGKTFTTTQTNFTTTINAYISTFNRDSKVPKTGIGRLIVAEAIISDSDRDIVRSKFTVI